ncbi:MAG: hypothetical protein M5U26_05925 [Planctomycetota bacterium]|nr:hypothetical protein [Planctomycetota bacterium]
MLKVYTEIVEFLAAGTTPNEIVAFQPSIATKNRVAELIEREKESQLSTEESAELSHYMELEHLMRLAKAKAREHLRHGP